MNCETWTLFTHVARESRHWRKGGCSGWHKTNDFVWRMVATLTRHQEPLLWQSSCISLLGSDMWPKKYVLQGILEGGWCHGVLRSERNSTLNYARCFSERWALRPYLQASNVDTVWTERTENLKQWGLRRKQVTDKFFLFDAMHWGGQHKSLFINMS